MTFVKIKKEKEQVVFDQGLPNGREIWSTDGLMAKGTASERDKLSLVNKCELMWEAC